MNIRNTIIKHYKKFFDLQAKGIALTEDDHLDIDWAECLVKDCFIPDVSNRLSFKEIGELADKWLEEEIVKDPEDRFTDKEKYWMLEGFIEGYKKAQNGC